MTRKLILVVLLVLAWFAFVSCSSVPPGLCVSIVDGKPVLVPCATPTATPTPQETPTPVATPTPAEPTPTPSPTPTVAPTSGPTPSAQAYPIGMEEEAAPGNGGDTLDPVAEALRHFLSIRGLKCEGESCDAVPTTCEQFQEDLAAELRSRGLSSGPVQDRLYVARPGETAPFKATWDCWHLAHIAWDGKIGCVVGFPHVDPSNSWCGSSKLIDPGALVPCPPFTDYSVTFDLAHLNDIILDATPHVRNKEYCSTVWRCPGLNCHEGFQIGCDLGPHDSQQRIVCENQYGPWFATCDGEELPRRDENPLKWTVGATSGLVKVCSAVGDICAEREIE